MEVIEVSRSIMDYLDAFKGSKPVVHDSNVMLIRGKSANRLKPENLLSKLTELFEDMNIKKVEVNSERARTITEQADKKLRMGGDVLEDEEANIEGVEKLKESFEMTGFKADYLIGEIEDVGVYVAMWLDKSGFGPMFVETMVVKLDS